MAIINFQAVEKVLHGTVRTILQHPRLQEGYGNLTQAVSCNEARTEEKEGTWTGKGRDKHFSHLLYLTALILFFQYIEKNAKTSLDVVSYGLNNLGREMEIRRRK